MLTRRSLLTGLVSSAAVLAACSAPQSPAATTAPGAGSAPATTGPVSTPAKASGTITIYSGRAEKLIAPLIERFSKATSIDAKVRYGDSAELAATMLEEGKNSPADVFFSQDAGALGAISKRDLLSPLPDPLTKQVDPRFRSKRGEWVATSGRARVLVYSTSALKEADLPDSALGLTDPKWKGKVGWAPTNASFQAFVTALRLSKGDGAARQWLQDMKANDVKAYKNNTAQVEATGKGELAVGLVNHYYLFGFLKDQGSAFPARNYHPRAGDASAMINVAGISVLRTAKNQPAALALVEYLLAKDAQQYFANETFEYPVIDGITTHELLVPLREIKTPSFDLSDLDDLDGTLRLMRDTGII